MTTKVITLTPAESEEVESHLAQRAACLVMLGEAREALAASLRADDELSVRLHGKYRKTRRSDHRFVRSVKTGLFEVVWG